MKKILLAFDGSHFSEGALRFVQKLNEKKPLSLTGVFLPQLDYANLWSHSGGGKSGDVFIPLLEDSDADEIKKNIERFESFCKTNHIHFTIHKDDTDFAVPELKKESRYADLLILSSESFFEQAGTHEPNDYLKEALHGVECPVLVIPEKFHFPNRNVLAYDGSETSVYAIKQFSYLFPELLDNPTSIVYAKEVTEGDIPAEKNIMELASRHFTNLNAYRLGVNAKKDFAPWLSRQEGALLVCGGFGRSGFSMVLRKSFVLDIIADHRMPVFLAHK